MSEACALVVAATFGASGITKLVQWRASSVALRNLVPLSAALSGPAVVVLGVGEIALSLGLASVQGRRISAVIATVALIAFTAVLAKAIASGVQAPCGCFGSISRESIGPPLLTRNTGLITAALVAAASAPRNILNLHHLTLAIMLASSIYVAQVVHRVLERTRATLRSGFSTPHDGTAEI